MNDAQINKSRALYYAMFSRFFVFSSDNRRYFELLNLLNILKDNPMDSTTGEAFKSILSKIDSDSNVKLMLEFDDIFHSPETMTVRTTASYFDENIESGKKRVEMQNFLAKTAIRRDEKTYSDYEDHIGFIFSVLAELSELVSEGEVQYKNTIHCIFEEILNEFIDEFSRELYEHESADIFKDVVVILKSFMTFERLYLEVSEYTPTAKPVEMHKEEEISEEEAARRARNKALRASGSKFKDGDDESCPVFVAYEVEDDIEE
ncbi:Putative formate dehydrogenase-specific chaperone [hydrothermal vent metagenome]|uniref:Putative formate dehydrogenase-specific chaperone n=1 Tax=hydrothermal vent metagenome TaxID=652676 RepID=A0A1W1EFX6_9ZZZZ